MMILSSTILLLARIKVKFHGGHFEDWHDTVVFLGIVLLFVIGVKLLVSVAKAVENGGRGFKRHGKKSVLLAVSLLAVFGFLRVMMRPSSTTAIREPVTERPDETLVQAAERNDVETVDRLLSSGVAPKLAWMLLLTPQSGHCCSLVSKNVDVGIVRRFLDSGASIKAALSDRDILWDLCSGACITPNCVEVARVFLDRGERFLKARRDSPIGGLRSVDHITGHHVEIVRLLLDRGDDPTRARDLLKILSERQKTSHDHGVEILELLLRHTKWPEKDLSEALDVALQGCRYASCRQAALLLLQNGVPAPKDVAKRIRELNEILGEANVEDSGIVSSLIRRLGGRVDPVMVPASVRHKSVQRADIRQLHEDFARGVYRFPNGPVMLKRAIEDGADVNAFDAWKNVPIVSLLGSPWTGTNLVPLVQIMIEHGARMNVAGESPLAVAVGRYSASCRTEVTNVVELLCRNGADPLASGRFGACALEVAFGLSCTTGKAELVRQLMDAANPTSKIPARVLVSASRADFANDGGAIRLSFVRELVERGASVTDAAVCAGWWDADVRRALLRSSGRREDDYIAVECGEARIARLIPKASGDEGADRLVTDSKCRSLERMVESERHFMGHDFIGGNARMNCSRIEGRLSIIRHRRAELMSRVASDERKTVEERFEMRVSEESNRVSQVRIRLEGMTNDVVTSASYERERQNRLRAWEKMELKLVAHGVADYRIREMRLEYEVETARWERSFRDRAAWRKRQVCDKIMDECLEWLDKRIREDERAIMHR